MSRPSLDRAAGREALAQRAWRHPGLVAGAALVGLVVAVAVLSLFWLPADPAAVAVAERLQGPSAAHWLGTDALGRDLAAQLMGGARSSLAVGLLAVGLGGSLGSVLGLWAAQRGGGVEEALMRGADFTFAFPPLLLALLLAATQGPGLGVSVAALAVFNVPVFARVARASAQAVRARGHILAARALGLSEAAITWRHVLPLVMPALVVQASIAMATALLAEAALAYLGLGTQPPQPSWGRMLADAQALLFQAPWQALPPGLAIATSVLGLNLLGDALRDLLDPRLQG